MLGVPLETYRGNRGSLAWAVFFGLAAAVIAYLVAESVEAERNAAYLIALASMLPFGLFAFWLNSVRVSLHPEGISYQSFFGGKEMRWDQIEKFYYGSVKQSVNFIPIGTYYTFKLVDATGQKLSFGNRVERPAELGQKLIELTYDPLIAKLGDLYNTGAELDFGPIRIQKESGVKVKKLFRWKTIPWDQVADYGINEGQFYIWPVGKKYVTGSDVRQVPNAFVLLGILDSLFGRTEPAAG